MKYSHRPVWQEQLKILRNRKTCIVTSAVALIIFNAAGNPKQTEYYRTNLFFSIGLALPARGSATASRLSGWRPDRRKRLLIKSQGLNG